MDEIVKAAMLKWPTVPHCHGWLALDARGDWYLRDETAQAAGPFPRVKGSRIEHVGLRDFIERNYEADASGCWHFQNGPQRVYVELEAAPWVWRLHALPVGVDASADAGANAAAARCSVTAQGARVASCRSAWLDELGRLFLDCDIGFGLVHSLDTGLAAMALEAGAWPLHELDFAQMPRRFGYRLRPQGSASGQVPGPE